MFLDARQLADNTTLHTDICIIGAGAAGITLAREFARQKFRVCVLESGGLTMDRATQKLEKVVNVGRSYPKLQRLRPRFFGGATGLWGGHLVPLRQVNFEKTDWLPYSGWPFGLQTLVPYYERAASMLRLKAYRFEETAEETARALGLPLFPFDPKVVESVASRYLAHSWNKAPSVGEVLYDEVKDAANVTFYLHANVTALNAAPDGRSLGDVQCKTLAGNRFTMQARQFVLATGGIENARMLLLSNHQFSKGIGNEHDLVGRFFMEHITYINGAIVPRKPQPVLRMYGEVVDIDGAYSRCHIAIPEDGVRAHRIPDFRSEIIISDKTAPSRIEKLLDDIHSRSLDLHLLDSRVIKWLRPYMKWDTNLNLTTPHTQSEKVVYRLSNYVEQVPNPDSRITLADKRDALGLNMAQVNWRLCELDRHGIRVAHTLIRQEVERSGFGQMEMQLPDSEDEILEGAKGGAHHMGTTRMHDDPKQGVVDAHQRVHGMENLYIAGSSVFPTGGYANPTFTLLAMTIRLADYLKDVMATF